MKAALQRSLILTFLLVGSAALTAGEATDFAEARKRHRTFRDEFMEQVLEDKDTHPLLYAFCGLYTGKDLLGANAKIREAWEKAAGTDKEMTAKEAGAENVKWCMRAWLRIYYLFSTKSKFFRGRLEAGVQRKLEEMFFLYGCHKSTVKRADLRFIWFIQGSENHDMMDLSNAYLALQVVQNLEAYKDKKLPDGHTPAEHVRAWEKYYAQYALERAKNGLFVEISPTYGKWFVGEFVNMNDFAESALVRKRMEMLLHLMWADWSIDQLKGVRGGGKTRCYQGHYSQSGGADSWDLMAQNLMGIKPWHWKTHGIFSTLALATSKYELPDVVFDLALNRKEAKPFLYKSTRPAKLTKGRKDLLHEKGYWMDGSGGNILRYSYCTPGAVMGSWMLDARVNYAAINSQNRWQGVVFSTGPAMRVFPQSNGQGNGKTYNQHVAVQHRNVMIVANHPKAKQTGQMRVYLSPGLRRKVVEKNGWVVVVNEGGARLGIKFLGSDGEKGVKNYDFKAIVDEKRRVHAYWIVPKKGSPPVVFALSRITWHRDLFDFHTYLQSHTSSTNGGVVSYTFVDDLGARVKLELGGKLAVPRIDQKPVDLKPKKVFDSPYMSSVHGSGIVTIRKGERKLTLNFNETAGKSE